MALTESEALFERFCKASEVKFERIEAGLTPTADYVAWPCGLEVICEIKQIELNAEEKKAMEGLKRGEFVVTGGTVGERVRNKINAAGPQIRAHAKDKGPGVLVLWEPFGIPRHLDAYNIRTAMYGFDTLVLNVPDIPGKVTLRDRKSGGGRRMTAEHNTSISALAVLREREGRIECSIYHNHFAEFPIAPESLACANVSHYRLKDPRPGHFDEWEQCA